MDNYDYDAEGNIKRLYDQESLLDILIEVEGVFDSMDLYAFKNWINGEIVKGPLLERYWVTVLLKYKFKEMPDPNGGLRLVKHGAKIKYIKSKEKITVKLSDFRDDPGSAYEDDSETGLRKRKTKEIKIWLVEVKIPRRFIEDMEKGQVYFNDEDENFVDLEDASEAEDEGLDDDTIVAGEGDMNQEMDQNENI